MPSRPYSSCSPCTCSEEGGGAWAVCSIQLLFTLVALPCMSEARQGHTHSLQTGPFLLFLPCSIKLQHVKPKVNCALLDGWAFMLTTGSCIHVCSPQTHTHHIHLPALLPHSTHPPHPTTSTASKPTPHLEHVRVELLLQALVGQVDAELLKGVVLKGLEAVDVQDADGAGRGAARAGACGWVGGWV